MFTKAFLCLSALFLSTAAFAAPQYTLQSVCETYGKVGRCGAVDFCQATVFQTGCYLAQGAPAYVEGLCKMQKQKWGCDLMQQQGNCVWVENPISTCNAKFDTL